MLATLKEMADARGKCFLFVVLWHVLRPKPLPPVASLALSDTVLDVKSFHYLNFFFSDRLNQLEH